MDTLFVRIFFCAWFWVKSKNFFLLFTVSTCIGFLDSAERDEYTLKSTLSQTISRGNRIKSIDSRFNASARRFIVSADFRPAVIRKIACTRFKCSTRPVFIGLSCLAFERRLAASAQNKRVFGKSKNDQSKIIQVKTMKRSKVQLRFDTSCCVLRLVSEKIKNNDNIENIRWTFRRRVKRNSIKEQKHYLPQQYRIMCTVMTAAV